MVDPFFTSRPAQPGDTCILAVPDDGNEIDQLRIKQRALQEIYGGQLTKPVHLTCQRFGYYPLQTIRQLRESLEHLAQQVSPFSITALDVKPIHSNFRDTCILKWEVEINPELTQFSNAITETLHFCNITPHFLPGSISSLITCLENIDPPKSGQSPPEDCLPDHLFTARQILISRIEAPFQYSILDSILITGNHD